MREPCITYERFPERQWRQRPPAKALHVPKDAAEPRQALAQAVAAGRDGYSALSVMIGRAPGYLWRFVNEGVPVALSANDHALLTDYLGKPLGYRDLWKDRS